MADGGEHETPAYTDRLLAAIDRVDDRLRNFQAETSNRFDGLSDRFMPRVEQMSRFDELKSVQGSLRERITTVEARRESDEQRRASERRTFIASLLAMATIAVSLLAIVLTHWKG